MTIWDDLAQRVRETARYHVHQEAPPPMYCKIISTRPLSMDQIDGPMVLHENDPDVELTHTVKMTRPKKNDVAIVQQTGPSDNPSFIVIGVINK